MLLLLAALCRDAKSVRAKEGRVQYGTVRMVLVAVRFVSNPLRTVPYAKVV